MKCTQCQQLIQGVLYWQSFCRRCALKKAASAQQHEGHVLGATSFKTLRREGST
jgi:hypothetical protein